MCDVVAVAAAGVAISAGSAYVTNRGQAANAKQAREYNGQVAALQINDRVLKMQEQNAVWEQDLQYAGDTLSYVEKEWDRQVAASGRAGKAIERNTLAATGTLLVRQVEEDMAAIAQGMEVRRQGAQGRARVASRDRGVEGNSVDAIVQDVSRQEGEATAVMAMNRAAFTRQINRKIIAADAQGDQQLANLTDKTFAPQVQVRVPGALASVAPAQIPQGPSDAALGLNIASAAIGGLTSYSTMNGQTVKDTFDNWAGRPPTIPTGGSAGRS